MASARTLALLDKLAWTALYAGLFAIVFGIVTGGVHVIAGWSFGVLGAIAAVTGVVLIVVRARLPETTATGAQSSPPSQEKT